MTGVSWNPQLICPLMVSSMAYHQYVYKPYYSTIRGGEGLGAMMSMSSSEVKPSTPEEPQAGSPRGDRLP
jgi:hypothetical protein